MWVFMQYQVLSLSDYFHKRCQGRIIFILGFLVCTSFVG